MEQITITGHIGNNATIEQINGNEYVKFNVAVNSRYKNKEGQQVERTNWYSCLKKGNTKIAEYLLKGTKILAQGTLTVNTYKNKNGEWCAGLNCNVQNIEFLSSKKDEETNKQNDNAKNPNLYDGDAPPTPEEDDLPF